VHSPAIWQPLRVAYGSALPRGVHPPAVLFVELDPEWVDCNVHPAKREVRFRDGIGVREAVQFLVGQALAERRKTSVAVPVRVFPESESIRPALTTAPVVRREGSPVVSLPELRAMSVPTPAPELPMPEVPRAAPERFRFIGTLAGRHILLEDEAGLVLLDHRAARERILFEQLLRRIDRRETVSQRLLLPAVVELPPRDLAWMQEHSRLLAGAGLLVEAFGAGTVKIDGVPPMLVDCDPRAVLLRIADDCRAGGAKAGTRAIEETIARSVCHSAPLGPPPEDVVTVRALIDELMACELPYACPNGRPTMIHFAHGELARKFGRA
jgi:DNA mismatch repair protein MutL